MRNGLYFIPTLFLSTLFAAPAISGPLDDDLAPALIVATTYLDEGDLAVDEVKEQVLLGIDVFASYDAKLTVQIGLSFAEPIIDLDDDVLAMTNAFAEPIIDLDDDVLAMKGSGRLGRVDWLAEEAAGLDCWSEDCPFTFDDIDVLVDEVDQMLDDNNRVDLYIPLHLYTDANMPIFDELLLAIDEVYISTGAITWGP